MYYSNYCSPYQNSWHCLRQCFLLLLLLCATKPVEVQSTPLVSHQWYRIRTPHFNILFPGHIQPEANRLANIMEHLYLPVSKTLHAPPAKYSLVLTTNVADSNGGTSFGPARINLYTFPSQGYSIAGSGSDWLNALVVHEFRHAVQFTKLSQHGFGEFFLEIASPLLVPILGRIWLPHWFFEGDAVGIETSLTKGGRGRLPYFSRLYRANLLERGGFGYQKEVCGSFKHNSVGPYVLGYHLTTHLRRRYGAQALSDIMWYVAWGMPFPVAV
ncbi:MAG: hypothetical protein AAFP93_00595, partial [Bacteroidota bacterium]